MNMPIFTEGKSFMRNPDRLEPEDIAQLSLHLPPAMTTTDRQRFLRSTSKAVDLWEQSLPVNPLSNSEIVDRMENLADAARALQRAIEHLRGQPFDVMDVHFGYLVEHSAPVFKLPESLRCEKTHFKSVLEGAWISCEALRTASKHAQTQIRIDRSIKPSAQKAGSLAREVIAGYVGVFAALPPTGKGSWLIGYMEALAHLLQLDAKFGYSMLTTAASHVSLV